MLREIKHILQGREQVALDEICFLMKIDKEVVVHALGLLIGKGLVEEVKVNLPCKSCSCGGSCGDSENRIYRLVP